MMSEAERNEENNAKEQVLFWLFEYCVKEKLHHICDEILEVFRLAGITPNFHGGENNGRSFAIYTRYLHILSMKDLKKTENLTELLKQIENILKFQPFQNHIKLYNLLIHLYVKIKLLLVNGQRLEHDDLKQMPYFNWEALKVEFNNDNDTCKELFNAAVNSAISEVQKCGSLTKRGLLLDKKLVRESTKYIKQQTIKVVCFLFDIFPATAIKKIADDADLLKTQAEQIWVYKILAENLEKGRDEQVIKKIVQILKSQEEKNLHSVDNNSYCKMPFEQSKEKLCPVQTVWHPMKVHSVFPPLIDDTLGQNFNMRLAKEELAVLQAESDIVDTIMIGDKILKVKKAKWHPMKPFTACQSTFSEVTTTANVLSPKKCHEVYDRECLDEQVSNLSTTLQTIESDSELLESYDLEVPASNLNSKLEASNLVALEKAIKRLEQVLQKLKQKHQILTRQRGNTTNLEDSTSFGKHSSLAPYCKFTGNKQSTCHMRCHKIRASKCKDFSESESKEQEAILKTTDNSDLYSHSLDNAQSYASFLSVSKISKHKECESQIDHSPVHQQNSVGRRRDQKNVEHMDHQPCSLASKLENNTVQERENTDSIKFASDGHVNLDSLLSFSTDSFLNSNVGIEPQSEIYKIKASGTKCEGNIDVNESSDSNVTFHTAFESCGDTTYNSAL